MNFYLKVIKEFLKLKWEEIIEIINGLKSEWKFLLYILLLVYYWF